MGGGEIELVLEELDGCIADRQNVESTYIYKELVTTIDCFLQTLTQTERNIFLCRYWYMDSIKDIALFFGFSPSKVASMLYRLRRKLRVQLEREGYL